MSNKFIISPHICSGYSYLTLVKTLRIKDLSTDVKKELNAAMSNKMITRVVTRIKPTWLVYLNDILSGNLTPEFKTCSDFDSLDSHATAISEAFKNCSPLSKDQSYVLECHEGSFRLKIETATNKDDKSPIERTRAPGPDGLNNAIRAYINHVFPKFLPTFVSEFLRTIQRGRIDHSTIDDMDHQFSEFLKFNCDSGIGVSKSDFLASCAPIDFYYAITYHRSPLLNPHNLLSLILLSRVAPTIGQNLQYQDVFLGKHDTIGSKSIVIGSDGVARRFHFENANNGRFGCTFRLTVASVTDKVDLTDVLSALNGPEFMSAFGAAKNEASGTESPDEGC